MGTLNTWRRRGKMYLCIGCMASSCIRNNLLLNAWLLRLTNLLHIQVLRDMTIEQYTHGLKAVIRHIRRFVLGLRCTVSSKCTYCTSVHSKYGSGSSGPVKSRNCGQHQQHPQNQLEEQNSRTSFWCITSPPLERSALRTHTSYGPTPQLKLGSRRRFLCLLSLLGIDALIESCMRHFGDLSPLQSTGKSPI